MPTEVLDQLKALRQNVAESLQKDPRFLTLTALDKSIIDLIEEGVVTKDLVNLVQPRPSGYQDTAGFIDRVAERLAKSL